ncbi:hypothetical protein NMY22_g15233 [Coprinellus aureogranulatus]|nr:hypothetical protein NMY22_g15233 [Coprinellus aureogranulatus]
MDRRALHYSTDSLVEPSATTGPRVEENVPKSAHAIAGVVLALFVVALIMIAFLLAFTRRRRRAQRNQPSLSTSEIGATHYQDYSPFGHRDKEHANAHGKRVYLYAAQTS